MTAQDIQVIGEGTFPGEARIVSVVRETVVLWLLDSRPGAEVNQALLDDLRLLTTEAATNAIRHSNSGFGGDFTVRELVADSIVRIEVEDAGPLWRVPCQTAGPDADHGRGLAIIEAYSDRWGTLPRPDNKGMVVWFEMPFAQAAEHAECA